MAIYLLQSLLNRQCNKSCAKLLQLFQLFADARRACIYMSLHVAVIVSGRDLTACGRLVWASGLGVWPVFTRRCECVGS